MNTKSIETVIYACYLLQDDCNIRERKGVNIYMPEKCKATEETWGPMTTAISSISTRISAFYTYILDFAEEQAIGDGHLTLIEVNRFSLFFIKYETF